MNIEDRIARLERQNRTLGLVVGGGLLGLGLLGATAFRQGTGVQEVVRAKRYEVVNTSGTRVVGYLDAGQLHLSARGVEGDSSAGWATTLTPEGVAVSSGKGLSFTVARLGKSEDGQALELSSGEGFVVLGNTSARNRRTGASTRFPVTTLTFFDTSGTVRYQVP